jgi:hypothetical protein
MSEHLPKNIRIKEDVLFKKNTDGTVVVLKLDDDENYFVIDGMAAKAWEMMEQEQDLGVIVKRLSSTEGVEEKVIQPHMDGFARQLLEEDLVVLN